MKTYYKNYNWIFTSKGETKTCVGRVSKTNSREWRKGVDTSSNQVKSGKKVDIGDFSETFVWGGRVLSRDRRLAPRRLWLWSDRRSTWPQGRVRRVSTSEPPVACYTKKAPRAVNTFMVTIYNLLLKHGLVALLLRS